MSDPALIPRYFNCLKGFLYDLAEQVFTVKSQEAIHLEFGIIRQKDIEALSTILKSCDLERTTVWSKDNDYNCFKEIRTYCGLIHGLIGYAPSLRPINDLNIEPTLYRKDLEVQKKTHISAANQVLPVSNPKQAENETDE